MNTRIVTVLLAVLLLTSCRSGAGSKSADSESRSMQDSIAEAIEYQLSHYPSSQYRDVYKNFMQDFFGPGHILTDTVAAGRYLRRELEEDAPFGGPLYEPTGFRGNFYRVNLSLLRDNKISYNRFFKAFVESVQGITPPPMEEWTKIWGTVDSVIDARGFEFENKETDRREIMKQLAAGNYVAHHSRAFNDSVHFHYRIISRENFQNEILPFLNETR